MVRGCTGPATDGGLAIEVAHLGRADAVNAQGVHLALPSERSRTTISHQSCQSSSGPTCRPSLRPPSSRHSPVRAVAPGLRTTSRLPKGTGVQSNHGSSLSKVIKEMFSAGKVRVK